MSAAGIIFSNIHDRFLSELTGFRTVGSVPFLCRYRLVDFPLSAMVAADISNIGLITHRNYHSLMDHIGSGKDFDLDRRSGGVRILPPHVTDFTGSGKMYRTRLEALIGILPFISGIREDTVVLSDCNTVMNMDMKALLAAHKESGADITVAVGDPASADTDATFYRAREGRVWDITEGTSAKDSLPGLNTMAISASLLRHLVTDAAAHGYTDFVGDILRRNLEILNIRTWRTDGPTFAISSLAAYFSANMTLVTNKRARDAIFSLPDRPVYTHSKSSPPTSYSGDAAISSSLIADGCRIRGRVENSVIFRGVRIGEGAVIRNCVIMQDTVIGEGAHMDYVICDKNAVIRDGRTLAGCEGTPFYIPKGHMA